MPAALNTEKFIQKAIQIHINQYDYSTVTYINNYTKIEIICFKHGSFFQEPRLHLSGHGCRQCQIERFTKSLEKFVCQATTIHAGKYDYSLTIYKNNRNQITIICPQHGSFLQMPSDHLKGQGCPACGIERQRKNQQSFIEQANKIHNNKYDYANVKYINSHAKISIKCSIHGIFLQSPADHLIGRGCRQCGIASQTKTRSDTLLDFIQKAQAIYGNKYDYSKVDYVRSLTKIEIICSLHGSFLQNPSAHLYGHGCPKCSSNISHMETKWLDQLVIPQECRQKYLKISGKKITADAYDPSTNTVYEFHGDFWHGNPEVYDQNDTNCVNNKTFGELYSDTLAKEALIKNAGYNLVSIWEADFINKNISHP